MFLKLGQYTRWLVWIFIRSWLIYEISKVKGITKTWHFLTMCFYIKIPNYNIIIICWWIWGYVFAKRIRVRANINPALIVCTTEQPLVFPQIYLYNKVFNRLIFNWEKFRGYIFCYVQHNPSSSTISVKAITWATPQD